MNSKRPLVWLDTETTSLRPDRMAWDIALIVRTAEGDDTEYQWFIDRDDLDLGNADPAALRIGRFYDRHPEFRPHAYGGVNGIIDPEALALPRVEALTRGAVLLGSNPGFDIGVLDARMRVNNICPAWHYRPIDVPTLALGVLMGRGVPVPARDDGTLSPEAVCRALGLDPSDYERHTALGDCRLFRDLFDAAIGEKVTA